jgi:hypothetical protein
LLDKAYEQEKQAADKANKSTQDLDKNWLDNKAKTLQDWRSDTAKTIDELIALEKKYRDAAVAADTEIANHKRSTQDLIKQLQGKTEVNSAADLSRLQGDAFTQKRGVTDALKTGDTDKALQEAQRVEQAYIDVAQKAKSLFDQGLIDKSAFDSTIYDLQQASKQVDQITAQKGEQDKQQADQLATDIANQQATLVDVDAQLNEIIEKTKQALVINVDKTSIDAAKATYDEITDKSITITATTVNDGGQKATDASVPGYASGTRLSGFGGGDRHPALLESGEGVLNKFAMRRLDWSFGKQFFDALNSGSNPLALLREQFAGLQLADGGRIADSLPRLNVPQIMQADSGGSNGTPITIQLPGGQQFGPFMGANDAASGLANALTAETLKRGTRR